MSKNERYPNLRFTYEEVTTACSFGDSAFWPLLRRRVHESMPHGEGWGALSLEDYLDPQRESRFDELRDAVVIFGCFEWNEHDRVTDWAPGFPSRTMPGHNC
jgi:hypothetical protein